MVNKKINIAILEPSEIIREGLISLLNKTGYNNSFHIFDEINELLHLSNDRLDILILNPLKLNTKANEFDFIRRKFPDLMIITFLHTIITQDVLRNFDHVFSIFDSVTDIKEKLNNRLEINRKINQLKDEKLSGREIEVLKLVVAGLSNKKIAEKLFISIHTVISHRKKLTQKTGIKSQAGLTIFAISNKIVDIKEYKYR